MISLKRKQSGFTIVELLIVIVVIGILAALVVTTFSGIQKKARDTERETDIKAIHGQLEAAFAEDNAYPQLSDLNSETWRGTHMKGLDKEALKDPKATSTTDKYAITADGANSSYKYVASPSGCTTECTGYTLTATKEGGGTFEKKSLN